MRKITLELSSELENQLRNLLSRQDRERIRQLLAEAFIPTVESLLQEKSEPLTDEDFESEADHLVAELAEYINSELPVLSNYADSREGIYEEHP